MKNFKSYTNSSDKQISELATILEEARIGLEQCEITKEQFNELVEDVLQYDKIIIIRNSLTTRLRIQRRLAALTEIAGKIGGIL